MEDTSVGEANPYNTHIVHMLCAKYGFKQSRDCPAKSSDRYFAKQSIDLLRIPWISPRYFAQSIDQADEVLFYFEVTAYTWRSCIASYTEFTCMHFQVANIIDIKYMASL